MKRQLTNNKRNFTKSFTKIFIRNILFSNAFSIIFLTSILLLFLYSCSLSSEQDSEKACVPNASGFDSTTGIYCDNNTLYNPQGFDIKGFNADGFNALGIYRSIDKILSGDGSIDDNFGISVSISKDTAVVGASNANRGDGAAYVFYRVGSTWVKQAKLLPKDSQRQRYGFFGVSVAIENDTIVVGADGEYIGRGSAYVFTRSGNSWTQQYKLVADDGVRGDNFGVSVAIDGGNVVVGATGDDNSKGSAYIFSRNGDSWNQQSKLVPIDGTEKGDTTGLVGSNFGVSVAIDGGNVVVGANGDAVGTGAAYVFSKSGNVWSSNEYFKLIEKDRGLSDVLDLFGSSVCISNDTIIVGAYIDEVGLGSAYIFTKRGNAWIQSFKLVASDGVSGDSFLFGRSVSIDGGVAVIGASGMSGKDGSGSAYIFTRNDSGWFESSKISSTDSFLNDSFGVSISLDGDTAIVGAYREFEWQRQGQEQGIGSSAYFFRYQNSNIK